MGHAAQSYKDGQKSGQVWVPPLRGRILRNKPGNPEKLLGYVRSCGFPPTDQPLPDLPPALTPEERIRLIELVMRQGKHAIGWRLRRANAYYEKFPGSNFEDQDAAAGLDLLNWQDKVSPRNDRTTGLPASSRV
jgi:hypothetical protein